MKWDAGKILSKRQGMTPDKPAVIFEDRPVTYGQVNRQTNQLAHFFRQSGLKKGDRIAVDLFNCPEFLVSYFAAAKLGLIFVPLNYRLVSSELRYQINHCRCRLLIFHEPIDLDDPFVILYTSGVTGRPKGAVVTHGRTYFKCFQSINYTDMRQDDICQSQAPLCRSAGLSAVSTPALCRGATLLMRSGFDPVKFARDIETYRATIVFSLTTMMRRVLDTGILDRVDTRSDRQDKKRGFKKTVRLKKSTLRIRIFFP